MLGRTLRRAPILALLTHCLATAAQAATQPAPIELPPPEGDETTAPGGAAGAEADAESSAPAVITMPDPVRSEDEAPAGPDATAPADQRAASPAPTTEPAASTTALPAPAEAAIGVAPLPAACMALAEAMPGPGTTNGEAAEVSAGEAAAGAPGSAPSEADGAAEAEDPRLVLYCGLLRDLAAAIDAYAAARAELAALEPATQVRLDEIELHIADLRTERQAAVEAGNQARAAELATEISEEMAEHERLSALSEDRRVAEMAVLAAAEALDDVLAEAARAELPPAVAIAPGGGA